MLVINVPNESHVLSQCGSIAHPQVLDKMTVAIQSLEREALSVKCSTMLCILMLATIGML